MNFLKISNRLLNSLSIDINITINGEQFTYPSITTIFPLDGMPAPSWGNYFDFNSNKKLTYNPRPENQQFNEFGKWKVDGRNELKLSKLLNYILDIIVANYDYFKFDNINIIKKHRNAIIELLTNNLHDFDFSVIKETKNIGEIYSLEVNEYSGSLTQSCMTPKYLKDREAVVLFNRFYKTLQNKGVDVSILYTTDNENKLTGRALLWKNVINCEDNSEFIMMDRIYGDEKTVNLFKNYAIEKHYAVKHSQSTNKMNILPDKSTIYKYYVNVKLDNIRNPPYMDSFTYYANSKLASYTERCKIYYNFDYTGGDFSGADFICSCGKCNRSGLKRIHSVIINRKLYNKECPNIFKCSFCNKYHTEENGGSIRQLSSNNPLKSYTYCNEHKNNVIKKYLRKVFGPDYINLIQSLNE